MQLHICLVFESFIVIIVFVKNDNIVVADVGMQEKLTPLSSIFSIFMQFAAKIM